MFNPRAHFGESLFTSMVSNSRGRVLGFDQHINRLVIGLNTYYLEKSITIDAFKSFYNLNNEWPSNKYVRISLFQKERTELISSKLRLSDIEIEILFTDQKTKTRSLSLLTLESPFSEFYRPVKSGSYFENFRLKKTAQAQGFDDGLLIHMGQILEASTSNIFFIDKNENLITPSNDNILKGITRKILLEKFDGQERVIEIQEFSGFQGAFLTNAVHGIMPINKINQQSFEETLSLKYKKIYNQLKEDNE